MASFLEKSPQNNFLAEICETKFERKSLKSFLKKKICKQFAREKFGTNTAQEYFHLDIFPFLGHKIKLQPKEIQTNLLKKCCEKKVERKSVKVEL